MTQRLLPPLAGSGSNYEPDWNDAVRHLQILLAMQPLAVASMVTQTCWPFALVMGAVAILQKPFSFAVLQAAIETAWRGWHRSQSKTVTSRELMPCHNLLDPPLSLG
jgi:FixJ family two-component response regulator